MTYVIRVNCAIANPCTRLGQYERLVRDGRAGRFSKVAEPFVMRSLQGVVRYVDVGQVSAKLKRIN